MRLFQYLEIDLGSWIDPDYDQETNIKKSQNKFYTQYTFKRIIQYIKFWDFFVVLVATTSLRPREVHIAGVNNFQTYPRVRVRNRLDRTWLQSFFPQIATLFLIAARLTFRNCGILLRFVDWKAPLFRERTVAARRCSMPVTQASQFRGCPEHAAEYQNTIAARMRGAYPQRERITARTTRHSDGHGIFGFLQLSECSPRCAAWTPFV